MRNRHHISIRVNFMWDPDASVYTCWSDDVPLATEADSFEALREKVYRLLPESLLQNGLLPDNDDGLSEIPVELVHSKPLQLTVAG